MENPKPSAAAQRALDEIRKESEAQQKAIDECCNAQAQELERLRQAYQAGGQIMDAAASLSTEPSPCGGDGECGRNAAPQEPAPAPAETGPAPGAADPIPPRPSDPVTQAQLQAAMASTGVLLGSIVSQKTEPEEKKESRKRKSRFRRRIKLIFWLAVLAALAIAAIILLPRIQAVFAPKTMISPVAAADLTQKEALNYTAVDFTDAVLGEARERGLLVVLEKDVQVDSQISQSLASISLFQKTKLVHSYGTGVYGVDLDQLEESGVQVDLEGRSVTIAIPPARLEYVYVDVDKTTFEETERGFLAFGDIKLTAEQQSLLEQSIDDALDGALNDPALFSQADAAARAKLTELFRPVVLAVSPDFTVSVITGQAAGSSQ